MMNGLIDYGYPSLSSFASDLFHCISHPETSVIFVKTGWATDATRPEITYFGPQKLHTWPLKTAT